jgi:hypothetical protein
MGNTLLIKKTLMISISNFKRLVRRIIEISKCLDRNSIEDTIQEDQKKEPADE